MKRLTMFCISLFLIFIAVNAFAFNSSQWFFSDFCDIGGKYYLTNNGRCLVLAIRPFEDCQVFLPEKNELPKNPINKEMTRKLQELEESFLLGEMNTEKFAAARKKILKKYHVDATN